ncbi:MAG: hypothetical protein JNL68_20065 [Burkholderiales bacterium]|nr:hypothetical protein [Burkholderiales bacterium]
MRPKTLITMAVTGMLAVPGLPALAADWSFQQLQVTDGYDAVQNYSPPPDRGAAGRPGRSAAEDTWLQEQLQRTDGYAEPSGASPTEGQSR